MVYMLRLDFGGVEYSSVFDLLHDAIEAYIYWRTHVGLNELRFIRLVDGSTHEVLAFHPNSNGA